MLKQNQLPKYFISLICIFIGWHFLYEGIAKVSLSDWTAAGYLINATGPFADFFLSLTKNAVLLKIIDWLNIIGLLAIGLCLLMGIFVRYAAIFGAVLLLLYYFVNPPFAATSAGYAVEGHYWIINKNLIEALVLLALASFPLDWIFGLQNILPYFKKSLAQNTKNAYDDLPTIKTLERRNLLRNMMWLPFLGTVSYSAFKDGGQPADAVSGATSKFDQKAEYQKKQARTHKPNNPMGKAKGIFPGRVVWNFNPGATNPLCTNEIPESTVFDEGCDAWFMDKNNNQDVVDKMLTEVLANLTGSGDAKSAWEKTFHFHNKQRGKGSVSYKPGEKIFIKMNRTSGSFGINEDMSRKLLKWSFCSETSPQITLAVLRQLVYHAGVRQEDIYLGDPMREIFADEFEKYFSEFPDVNYLSHFDLPGRTLVKESEKELIFYSDKKKVMPDGGADKLYDIAEKAEYLINLPVMKGHLANGISLFAKNHFGTQSRESAVHLHAGLNEQNHARERYGEYRVLVDYMGNKHTGDKNLIYILDGLWAGDNWNAKPVKFKMPPFNNHWSSSVLVSFDPVAIESVAFDILRTEFITAYSKARFYIDKPAVDDYLHQAADKENWPEKVVYTPNGDGNPIAESLGVHEHWNNETEQQYSRNLGTGEGIELVKNFENSIT